MLFAPPAHPGPLVFPGCGPIYLSLEWDQILGPWCYSVTSASKGKPDIFLTKKGGSIIETFFCAPGVAWLFGHCSVIGGVLRRLMFGFQPPPFFPFGAKIM